MLRSDSVHFHPEHKGMVGCRYCVCRHAKYAREIHSGRERDPSCICITAAVT